MSFLNIFGSTTNGQEEHPPPPSSSPAASAAASPTRRPTTRSQSRGNPSNLQLPLTAFNGVARGRRSPSPQVVGHNDNSAVIFTYDSTNISEKLLQPQQHTVDAGRFENADEESETAPSFNMSSIEELRASAAAAVEAANAATAALVAASSLITQQSTQQPVTQIRTRKPDLPEFDARNVEIWLKRVQSAYDRAGISLPRDKFAHLESKFAVGANPTVDAFLYGPATAEAWDQFVAYMTEEYGRTVRQEAQFLRGQMSRDNRRPSQMLAHINEKTKRVTIDDIKKEIVISSLPMHVQQMIAERVKDLLSAETAAIADKYFDQEGRPLHAHTSHITHVGPPQAETTRAGEDDDDDNGISDVNAIRGRRGGRGGFRGNGGRSFRPSNNNFNSREGGHSGPPRGGYRSFNNGRGGQHQTPPSASSTHSASASSSNATKTMTLCNNHQRFGDKTITCHEGCSRWPEVAKRQQGNANAGNRK